jgi:hypothetical protein
LSNSRYFVDGTSSLTAIFWTNLSIGSVRNQRVGHTKEVGMDKFHYPRTDEERRCCEGLYESFDSILVVITIPHLAIYAVARKAEALRATLVTT